MKSTRYTPLTFFPIALFLQYKKVVVCFFTFNTIVQSIPAVSTNTPLASAIPVLFVIFLGIIKEAYLEYKRWKDDKTQNQRACFILDSVSENGGLHFREDTVQNIRVGDILRLPDDSYVPADCILLRQATAQDAGQAFTQTDALDGERVLRSKLSNRSVQSNLDKILCDNELRLLVPRPTPEVYDFKATIELDFKSSSASANQSE